MDLYALFGNTQMADWILNIGVQSTIILTVSLFLRRVCRTCSAPTRSNICFITMIVLLVLPIGSLISRDLSPLRIDLNRSSTVMESPELHTTNTVNANPALSPVVQPQMAPFRQNKVQQLSIYVVNFWGVVWLAGILLMAVRLGYGLSYTRKIVSRLPKLKHDRLVPVLDGVMDVFGTFSPPDIYASMAAKSPQTVGLLAPCIILPSDIYEKTDEEELKSILLHEMSHIYHNDQWAGVLQRIISIIFWWNPLTYGLSADFSHEREYVCDMYASLYGNPKVFANCLFHLARHAQAVKLLPTALCAIRSKGILEKRIHKILSGGQIMKTTLSTKTSLFQVMISIVVAGLLISVNWTMADQQSSPKNIEIGKLGMVTEPGAGLSQSNDLPNEDLVYQIGEVETPPEILQSVPPVYPPEAKKNNISGHVKVEFVVTKEGVSRDEWIVESEPPDVFDEAALETIRQWRFAPGTRNGEPVEVRLTLPVSFELDGPGWAGSPGAEDVPGISSAENIPIPAPAEGEGGPRSFANINKSGPVEAGDVQFRVVGQIRYRPSESEELGDFRFNMWPEPTEEVDTPPTMVPGSGFPPPPQYPLAAARDKIEGRVVLRFVVDTDGKVKNPEVVEADPEGVFEETMLAYIEQFEFTPATLDGEPVPCMMNYTIECKLD